MNEGTENLTPAPSVEGAPEQPTQTPEVNKAAEVKAETSAAPETKQNWFSRLFGRRHEEKPQAVAPAETPAVPATETSTAAPEAIPTPPAETPEATLNAPEPTEPKVESTPESAPSAEATPEEPVTREQE